MSRSIMPISYTNGVRVYDSGLTRYKYTGASDDASGCEPILEAPGSGYELVVEKLSIAVCAAVTVTVGEGETSGNHDKVLLGSLGGAANGFFPFNWKDEPVVLAPNKSLTIKASGAGKVSWYIEAFKRAATAAVSVSSSPSSSKSSSPSSSRSSSPSTSASASPSGSPSQSPSVSLSPSPSSSASA